VADALLLAAYESADRTLGGEAGQLGADTGPQRAVGREFALGAAQRVAQCQAEQQPAHPGRRVSLLHEHPPVRVTHRGWLIPFGGGLEGDPAGVRGIARLAVDDG
jgi:hypothetical protein